LEDWIVQTDTPFHNHQEVMPWNKHANKKNDTLNNFQSLLGIVMQGKKQDMNKAMPPATGAMIEKAINIFVLLSIIS
jgi:hypothetical protein